MKNKLIVSWKDYTDSIIELANIVKNQRMKFDFVYGIPTGGTPIAFFISKFLKIPQILEISPGLVDRKHNYLVVDDLCDSGSTFIKFADTYNRRLKFRTACLYLKDKSRYVPHYVSVTPIVPHSTWIYYPYDELDTDPIEETQNHLMKTMVCSK